LAQRFWLKDFNFKDFNFKTVDPMTLVMDFDALSQGRLAIRLAYTNTSSICVMVMQPSVQFDSEPTAASRHTKKRGKRRVYAWGFAMLGVVGAIATATTWIRSSPSQPPIDLATETVLVQTQDLQLTIKANGVVQAERKTNIGPKEAGRIVELLVREGERVQQGQIIARMDDEQIRSQVAQFQAGVLRSQADLDQKLAGNRPEDIAKAESEVVRYSAQLKEARSKLDLANQKYDRRQALENEGAISLESLDEAYAEVSNAQDSVTQAQANLEGAQQDLAKSQNGSRPEEIAQAQAQVAEAEAQLQSYQIQLDNTLVRAPFSGIITRRFADVGDFVAPTTSASTSDGATSASIVELSSGLEIEAKVPEASISSLKPGQSVDIRSDSYPDETFTGKVSLIAPRAIQENNITTFRVKIRLNNGLDLLKAGMNARLVFLGNPIADTLVVPLATIMTQDDGQKGVWLIDVEGETKFHPVRLGAESSNQAQILDGLKEGDRILLSPPADQLIPGVDNTEGTGL
jgi:HlyD family secretion protein